MLDAGYLSHHNDKHYFFFGCFYWRFDQQKGEVDPGYPKLIADHWPGVPNNIDAVCRGQGDRASKVYFFKGDLYWRFEQGIGKPHKVDDGYPKKIADHWPGLWSRDIGAAVTLADHIFFFKLGEYIRYDFHNSKVAGGPSPISHWGKMNERLGRRRLDCVVQGTGGYANDLFFFASDRGKDHVGRASASRLWVTKYDTANITTDHPQKIAGHADWTGLASGLPQVLADRLAQFQSGTGRGVFTHLDRAEVANGLRRILASPYEMRQRTAPICGPAAVLYWLARTDPKTFLEYGIELFETGEFIGLGGDKVKVSRAFMDAALTDQTISQAAWMMAVGVKDDINGKARSIDGTEEDGKETRAMGTSARILRKLAENLLGYGNMTVDRCYVKGERKALMNADDSRAGGGVAFYMVNTQFIGAASEKGKKDSDQGFFEKRLPNHWVVGEGNVIYDEGRRLVPGDDRFRFDIWTWGRLERLNLAEGEFEDGFFGAVYGGD